MAPVTRGLEFIRENTIGVVERYLVLLDVRGENERLKEDNGKLKVENHFLKAELEAADLMMLKAATLYDAGEPCGIEANAAKYLAAEAAHDACQNAVLTLGGMGYAKEYHVERLLRESYIPRIAPVSPQMILNFIAEKALGLPKSY